jgi:hypothetical protein
MARRLGRGQEGVLTVGFSGSVMLTHCPQRSNTIAAFIRGLNCGCENWLPPRRPRLCWMEHWIWVSFATANRGMGCRLNRSCENGS